MLSDYTGKLPTPHLDPWAGYDALAHSYGASGAVVNQDGNLEVKLGKKSLLITQAETEDVSSKATSKKGVGVARATLLYDTVEKLKRMCLAENDH